MRRGGTCGKRSRSSNGSTRPCIATALNELGLAAYEGDYAEAVRLLQQSLAIKQGLGDDWLTANSLVNLGLASEWGGDHARGYELHADSLALFEGVGDPIGVAIATHNLARAAMHLGRLDEALERLVASLRTFDEIGDADGCAECLEGLAMLANARDDSRRAAQLFGLAAVVRKEAGTQPAMFQLAEVERELDITRSRLDQATFDTEWQAGHEMSVEAAIELVGAFARTVGGMEESAQSERPAHRNAGTVR